MTHRYFSQLYYHIVWGTKYRHKQITKDIDLLLKNIIPKKIKTLNGKYHICNMVEDHIHILCEIPTNTSIAEFVRQLKGATSYTIKKICRDPNFTWQNGYGAFSVSKHHTDIIYTYILNQKTHHNSTLPII